MTVTTSPAAAELLTLLQVRGIGPATLLKLVRSTKDQNILDHAISVKPELEGACVAQAQDRAAEVAKWCKKLGITIVGYFDAGYPGPLRRIPDPPLVLYVRGSLDALQKLGFAVVGTRRASCSGLRIAGQIASHLAGRNISVVSGLAIGIDQAAHQGALDAGGITVAVLAHGLDSVAPRRHISLANNILRHNGALVSEHPPGTPPRPAEFVRRNRLQSGISAGSVIVESGVTGGAIHQASFTARQNRLLLTVFRKNRSDDLNQAGADRLVSDFGAIPIRTVAELDAQLSKFNLKPRAIRPPEAAVQGRLEL